MRTPIIIMASILLLAACKKEEDRPTTTPVPEPAGYSTAEFAPFTPGSWWVYDAFLIDPATGVETPSSSNDSIYMTSDTLIGGDTYHRLRGIRFSQPFQWLLRFDGPQLVDQNGGVYFDVSAASDTVDVWPGSWPIDSTAFVLSCDSFPISSPITGLMSEYGRTFVNYMSSGFPSPQYGRDRWVRHVGLGLYESHYSGSGIQWQFRLRAYHLE
jgi:hypothetical protein